MNNDRKFIDLLKRLVPQLVNDTTVNHNMRLGRLKLARKSILKSVTGFCATLPMDVTNGLKSALEEFTCRNSVVVDYASNGESVEDDVKAVLLILQNWKILQDKYPLILDQLITLNNEKDIDNDPKRVGLAISNVVVHLPIRFYYRGGLEYRCKTTLPVYCIIESSGKIEAETINTIFSLGWIDSTYCKDEDAINVVNSTDTIDSLPIMEITKKSADCLHALTRVNWISGLEGALSLTDVGFYKIFEFIHHRELIQESILLSNYHHLELESITDSETLVAMAKLFDNSVVVKQTFIDEAIERQWSTLESLRQLFGYSDIVMNPTLEGPKTFMTVSIHRTNSDIHTVKFPRTIKNGDNFNVYHGLSSKSGGVWKDCLVDSLEF
ncbi:hypothetical protein A1QO_04205 [Vibrio genomosp. F10 str. ZF-129]|uniref:Uncharacterized protein n=1 Tax=Vibrio genomosp. F10 str. ZF-129 TaxID=1187848 RepID=A0A1E5BIP0_9VIBR|nr:hypothetical protein [Vibrio genomosp. F10]OEE37315.1 hypothetical protein A1QO_04205 [Vibrio genomosp. F10 str. ZF-129]